MLNFRYQGDNSASNAMEFGFFGNEGLMKVYKTGKVGIGTGSTSPSLSTFTIQTTNSSQLNITTNGYAGMYLHTNNANQAIISAGACWDGSGWLAQTNNGNSYLELKGNTFSVYTKAVTTNGNYFTPEQVCLCENYQWYFCDKYNTLGMYTPYFASKKPADAQQPGQWCIYKDPNYNRIVICYNDNGIPQTYVLFAW